MKRRGRTGEAASVTGVLRRNRASLLLTTALQAACLAVVTIPAVSTPARAQPAPNARPTGGTVVGGSATINQSSTTNTLVTQSTQRGAINWQSFDVGASQSVTFAQPNSSAITLNRVEASQPSQVAGKISANGQLVIVNQSGVVFFPGSQVNAQSLVVSAAGIDPKQFMAGSLIFDQPAKPNARIVNAGTLTAGKAGLIGLVAPSVANSGVITAKMGHVVLAGAAAETLDMYGDGLISLDVTKQVTTVPVGPGGKKVTALVTNTGLIRADGGTVQLTAVAADGIVQNLVTAGGTISARTTAAGTGSISILGTGGSVTVDGALLANGNKPGQTGGQIAVNATNTVTIAKGARIAANGRAGGGTIALGTTLARAAGGASVTGQPTAKYTVVQSGANVSANATSNGAGGTIAVLSTALTTMQGLITATGGALGGDGGFVELSGANLQLGGSVDVTAAHGVAGAILLDPMDLTIGSSGGTAITATASVDPNISYSQGGTLTNYFVTPADLDSLTGNIHLQASRSLVVASSFGIPGYGVTLEAGNNLTVSLGATITATNIVLTAGDNFNGAGTIPGYNAAASLTVAGVLSAGGGITLTAPTGGVLLSGLVSGSSLNLATTGPVVQSGGTVIASTLTGSAASISLLQGNTISSTNGVATTTGNFLLSEAPGVQLTVSGSLSVPSGQSIELIADSMNFGASAAGISAPSGRVILAPATVTNGISISNAPTVTANTLVLNFDSLGSELNTATLVLGDAQTTGPITLGSTTNALNLTGINVTGTGGTSLGVFTTGAVTAPGNSGIQVGTIFGSAGSVLIEDSGDLIGAIGSLSANTVLAVLSGEPVTVNGPLSAGTSVEVAAYGTLTLAGNITSTTGSVSLYSNYYSTPGTITDIEQIGGSITAANLLASAAGGPIVLSGVNQVGTLTGFVAVGQAFLNNVGSLVLTGSPPTSANPTLVTTGALSITNGVTSFGGAGLLAAGGSVGIAGSLISTIDLGISAGGILFETGAGIISTPSLALTGHTLLQLTGANLVGTLTSVSAISAAFNFADAENLAVTGNVSAAGSIALSAAAANTTLTVNGGFINSSGSLVALTFDNINLSTAIGTGISVAGGGTVALAPSTAGRGIYVYNSGATVGGDLNIAMAGIGSIEPTSPVTLQLGSPTTGTITLGNTADVLSFGNNISTLQLVSNATGLAVTQGLSAALYVGTVTGSSAGSVNLGGTANEISTLGGFTSSGGFTLTTTNALTVAGSTTLAGVIDNATGGTIAITTTNTGGMSIGSLISGAGTVVLNSAGTIGETTGFVSAVTLAGSATSASFTSGEDQIGTLGAFTTSAGFALTSSQALTVAGPVTDTGTGDTVALTSTGGDMTISGVISATNDTVSLTSFGAVNQTGGSIAAATLIGSGTLATFGQTTNAISQLGSFSTQFGFTLVDSQSLTVTGVVSDAFVGVSLQTTNGDMTLTAGVSAPNVTLTSAGTIGENGGFVTATTLSGSATSASFTGGADQVGTLGVFATSAGFALIDTQSLTVTGPINDSSNAGVSLQTTSGDITLAGAVNVNNGTLALMSAGTIAENGGSIQAAYLTGSATSAVFTSGFDYVDTLGTFTTSNGFTLADQTALIVSGPVTDATNILLTSLGSFYLTGDVVAPTITINALTLQDAPPSNLVQSSGTIGGAVNGNNTTLIALSATGSISLFGSVIADVGVGTVSLNATGGQILENAGSGFIQAATLTGSSTDITSLIGSNSIATLGSFSSVNGFTLIDALSLTVVGPVTDPPGVSITDNAGDLTISGSINAPTIELFSTFGTIGETTGGSLVGSLLTGGANGAVDLSLAGANTITALGSFSGASFLFANVGPLSVTGPITASIGSVLLRSDPGGGLLSSLDIGGTVSASNGSTISLVGDALSFANADALISAPGGTVSIAPSSVLGIDVFASGTAMPGTLAFDMSETAQITTATLSFGSPTTGNIILGNTGDALAFPNVSTLQLISGTGSITQTGSASLSIGGGDGTLTGSTSLGAVGLTGTGNLVGVLGSFSAQGGPFALTDSEALSVLGPVVGPTIELTTSAGGITLGNASVSANVLQLNSAGTISQTGSIFAGMLQGSATNAYFTSSYNQISQLGSFTTPGTLAVTTFVGDLTVSGPVIADTGLALTNNLGALVFTGNVTAPQVALVAVGGIVQTGGGLFVTGTLTGSGGSNNVSLPSTTNMVANLGSFAGAVTLTDGEALTVTGPVTSTNLGALILTTTTGDLTLAGNLVGPTILHSAGAIVQNSGSISGALSGSAATTVNLIATTNSVSSVGSFSSGSSFSLKRRRLAHRRRGRLNGLGWRHLADRGSRHARRRGIALRARRGCRAGAADEQSGVRRVCLRCPRSRRRRLQYGSVGADQYGHAAARLVHDG